jgi:putative SbcD/Mre11-related phosphoesterase
MEVEPVPNAPAATVEADGQRLLLVADYHAGIETVLKREGVELDSGGEGRRNRLLGLVGQTQPDRLLVLGDLVHAIGDPWDAEQTELEALFDALDIPVTLVKGNHDGDVESFLDGLAHEVTVTDSAGIRIGDVGFTHGHTWPAKHVLGADVVCIGHEHPVVRLEDTVGGHRKERVWLRGRLGAGAFGDAYDDHPEIDGELVVCPAFNDLSGGTWVNVEGQTFLSPFLPDGLVGGDAYLLDGTRLGAYRSV